MAEKYEIALQSNRSFMEFEVDLSSTILTVSLHWNVEGDYYMVKLSKDGVMLAGGLGLHPNIDLLRFLKLGVGKLYLEGHEATPDTLGIKNRLVYESV